MQIIIVGAGGHGRVVLEAVRLAGEHEPVAILDANSSLWGSNLDGVLVVGGIEAVPSLIQQYGPLGAIVGIGDNAIRAHYAVALGGVGLELVTVVHPQAFVAPSAKLGPNTFVAARAIVCTKVVAGANCIVNSGAIVEHECVIADDVHVAPGAKLAGRVSVLEGAFVGLGACIIQNCMIGAWSVVGAGAVVTRNVPDRVTVVGSPARALGISDREGR